MSLVSEALKKAEREAAAREARGRDQPVPFEAPLQPYRSRRGARFARATLGSRGGAVRHLRDGGRLVVERAKGFSKGLRTRNLGGSRGAGSRGAPQFRRRNRSFFLYRKPR